MGPGVRRARCPVSGPSACRRPAPQRSAPDRQEHARADRRGGISWIRAALSRRGPVRAPGQADPRPLRPSPVSRHHQAPFASSRNSEDKTHWFSGALGPATSTPSTAQSRDGAPPTRLGVKMRASLLISCGGSGGPAAVSLRQLEQFGVEHLLDDRAPPRLLPTERARPGRQLPRRRRRLLPVWDMENARAVSELTGPSIPRQDSPRSEWTMSQAVMHRLPGQRQVHHRTMRGQREVHRRPVGPRLRHLPAGQNAAPHHWPGRASAEPGPYRRSHPSGADVCLASASMAPIDGMARPIPAADLDRRHESRPAPAACMRAERRRIHPAGMRLRNTSRTSRPEGPE